MVSIKKIKAALPHLSELELWLLEKDAHRAADAAALGGATPAQWNRYLDCEATFHDERVERFGAGMGVSRSFLADHTPDELKALDAAWRKIRTGKFGGGK
jgi:hypothetical protein